MHSFPLAGVDVHEGVGRQAWVGGLARRGAGPSLGSVSFSVHGAAVLVYHSLTTPQEDEVTSLALGVMVGDVGDLK